MLRAPHGHMDFLNEGDLFAGPRLWSAASRRITWVLRSRNGAVGLVLRVTARIQEAKQRVCSALTARPYDLGRTYLLDTVDAEDVAKRIHQLSDQPFG